jgi:hypothetical protein
MPVQKDFKRLVRARMQKTGEAYTAARQQLLNKREPPPDYAAVAGMSEAIVTEKTGRTWAEWVRVLDAAKSADKPHREIARYVSSLGTPGWWTQMVTVGYERIKGLRAIGQRRDGSYEANKSRTFGVPIKKLFDAFANDRTRKRWLGPSFTVRSSLSPKRMTVKCADNTVVQIGFWPKGAGKSAVSVQHQKLPDRSAVDATKKAWGERFDRLGDILA